MSEQVPGAAEGKIPFNLIPPQPVPDALATAPRQDLAKTVLDTLAAQDFASTAKQDVSASLLTSLKAALAFDTHEVSFQTLTAATSTRIDFTAKVSMVRITNWSTDGVLLAKAGTIANDTDSTAARVPQAASASQPGILEFPFATTFFYVRIPAGKTNRDVTVEGFR